MSQKVPSCTVVSVSWISKLLTQQKKSGIENCEVTSFTPRISQPCDFKNVIVYVNYRMSKWQYAQSPFKTSQPVLSCYPYPITGWSAIYYPYSLSHFLCVLQLLYWFSFLRKTAISLCHLNRLSKIIGIEKECLSYNPHLRNPVGVVQ